MASTTMEHAENVQVLHWRTSDGEAAEEGWGIVVPAALAAFSKYDDHWISAPFNAHSTSWVWAKKAVLADLGIASPQLGTNLLQRCKPSRIAV